MIKWLSDVTISMGEFATVLYRSFQCRKRRRKKIFWKPGIGHPCPSCASRIAHVTFPAPPGTGMYQAHRLLMASTSSRPRPPSVPVPGSVRRGGRGYRRR